jgi:hypothetical protein
MHSPSVFIIILIIEAQAIRSKGHVRHVSIGKSAMTSLSRIQWRERHAEVRNIHFVRVNVRPLDLSHVIVLHIDVGHIA